MFLSLHHAAQVVKMHVVYFSLAHKPSAIIESRKNSTAVSTRSHFYRTDTTRLDYNLASVPSALELPI
jgi:hypothetical protein